MAAQIEAYPLRFDVQYPGRLSRWLIFVKWLVAIPHFFVPWALGTLQGGAGGAGGGRAAAPLASYQIGEAPPDQADRPVEREAVQQADCRLEEQVVIGGRLGEGLCPGMRAEVVVADFQRHRAPQVTLVARIRADLFTQAANDAHERVAPPHVHLKRRLAAHRLRPPLRASVRGRP